MKKIIVLLALITVSAYGQTASEVDLTKSAKPKFIPIAQPFFPGDSGGSPIAFTKVPFRVNGKSKGLDGYYRIDVFLDDVPYLSVNEPYLEFTPIFQKHEGKKMKVEIWCKPFGEKDNVLLDFEVVRIQPPPLNILMEQKVGNKTNFLRFKAMYGIEGYYSEVPAPLHIVNENKSLVLDTVAYCTDAKPGSSIFGGVQRLGLPLEDTAYYEQRGFNFAVKVKDISSVDKSTPPIKLRLSVADKYGNSAATRSFYIIPE